MQDVIITLCMMQWQILFELFRLKFRMRAMRVQLRILKQLAKGVLIRLPIGIKLHACVSTPDKLSAWPIFFWYQSCG